MLEFIKSNHRLIDCSKNVLRGIVEYESPMWLNCYCQPGWLPFINLFDHKGKINSSVFHNGIFVYAKLSKVYLSSSHWKKKSITFFSDFPLQLWHIFAISCIWLIFLPVWKNTNWLWFILLYSFAFPLRLMYNGILQKFYL